LLAHSEMNTIAHSTRVDMADLFCITTEFDMHRKRFNRYYRMSRCVVGRNCSQGVLSFLQLYPASRSHMIMTRYGGMVMSPRLVSSWYAPITVIPLFIREIIRAMI